MEKSLLQEKIITEIMSLTDDRLQMLLDFIGYLKFLQHRQCAQKSETYETDREKFTAELIALSGICSSDNGDLADNHNEYLYEGLRSEI
ncbi:MAG: hypothetical protein ABRQ38_29220 [Candidatus Eremiobacterota bacterium]